MGDNGTGLPGMVRPWVVPGELGTQKKWKLDLCQNLFGRFPSVPQKARRMEGIWTLPTDTLLPHPVYPRMAWVLRSEPFLAQTYLKA